MSYYLSKYVGKYRLKAVIDKNTNDFPRDFDGQLEQYDVYIKCNNDIQITYYGHGILQCYVPSLIRGHNILKDISQNMGLIIKSYEKNPFDYEQLYKDLVETKIISYISETDEEIIWRFKDKDLEFMFQFITPQTYGASISPFSSKNLPKKKYEINQEDLVVYKKMLDSLEQKDKLATGLITRQFIKEYIPKTYKQYRNQNMDAVMKKTQLKGKEFIHSIGLWNEYIEYLKRELINMGVLNA